MRALRYPDTALWDWPHRDDIDGASFDDALEERGLLLRWLARTSVTRGMLLWWMARRYAVAVIGFAGNATRAFLLLERLFGTGRRYVVVLHFIPETTLRPLASWRELFDIHYWVRAGKLPYLKLVVKPALRKSLLRCQMLTAWEMRRDGAFFDLPSVHMRLLRYPLVTEEDVLPAEAAREGVMASGRAACDWPTVFELAANESWPLTIVCGKRELRQVRRLNGDRRATVLVDIAPEEHFRLIARSAVYVLALRDVEASSGQIRLSDAVRAGTPVVASRTVGIAEYIEDERTALSFAPGDAATARRQVRRLLDDAELWNRQRAAAFERAAAWSRERYRESMRQMVRDAVAETGAVGVGTPAP
jgi:glycosyltransferase involved in cell wall biosynthesis